MSTVMLAATEEDVNAEIEKMAETYKMKAEDVRKYIDMSALNDQILRNKAIAVIRDSGIAVPPKSTEEPAEAPTEE